MANSENKFMSRKPTKELVLFIGFREILFKPLVIDGSRWNKATSESTKNKVLIRISPNHVENCGQFVLFIDDFCQS